MSFIHFHFFLVLLRQLVHRLILYFFQLKFILTALIGQRNLIRIKLHLQPWLSKYNAKVEGLQQALNIQIDSNDLKRKRDAASNLKVVFLGWTHLSSVHRYS